MLLAIDAGNTNIVFAVHGGKTVRAQFRAVTKDNRTADEYYVWLAQLLQLEGVAPDDISAAIISSVVPPALFWRHQGPYMIGSTERFTRHVQHFGLLITMHSPN